MKTIQKKHISPISESRQRHLEGIHLQKIEGNPLAPEEIEMFEMFEREGWPYEQRRVYIQKLITEKILPQTTE